MAGFLKKQVWITWLNEVVVAAAWLFLSTIAPAQFSPSSSAWRPGQVLEYSLLFHPARSTESWLPPPAALQVQDVWLRTPDGTRIHAWWFPQPGAQGAVLFCHGNAGNLSHRTQMIAGLIRSLGESVLIFDYPGYGKSAGRPSEAGCYAAADATYDWLTQVAGIPGEQVVLFGESLGGGVATELASRRPHRALVLVKTFTSIPDMARQHWLTSASSGLVQNRFDNLAKIGGCARPVFIAHGDRDRVIPLSQGQELYRKAREPKQFFLLEGSDHNDPLPTAFFASLQAFLRPPTP
jgi:fermentation-respiration switch protein FrsA (DUF1100 family)